jgi:creatinine amidohydrolase
MKISEMNWMQTEERARLDNRAVLPIGSTEQHAYLSLCTDSILAERVAVEAAEPLGVPVFPVLAYGITPSFRAYPGSVSLRVETFACMLRDLLDGIGDSGFRRILIVNGHGGNAPAQQVASEWMADREECVARLHNWWMAPRVAAKVGEIDPAASHASWMENFPWTRLAGVVSPGGRKPVVDFRAVGALDPRAAREALGDGSGGGPYQRDDAEMRGLWEVAVGETRAMLTDGWDGGP